jgi:uncharacterized protein
LSQSSLWGILYVEAIIVRENMVDRHLLEEVKKRLVATYCPVEIYIFGSYAWGCPDEESDLDILVVVEDLNEDRYRLLVEGHRALMDLPLSKDLLLLSKKEFERDSENVSTIHYKIKRKGKRIYAKA